MLSVILNINMSDLAQYNNIKLVIFIVTVSDIFSNFFSFYFGCFDLHPCSDYCVGQS